MEYKDLCHCAEFVEDGQKYRVVKNISHFISLIVPNFPLDEIVILYRPYDNGITFRTGTMPSEVKITKWG